MHPVYERLHRSGLRATACRQQILDALLAAPDMRATVDVLFMQLHGRGARVSISTLYAALRVMRIHGVIARDWDGEKAIYWVPQDAAGAIHYVCHLCKQKHTIHDDALFDAVRQSAQTHGLAIGAQALTIQVVCHRCQHPDARRRPVRLRPPVIVADKP
ncbi:MAG: transcriptional repressor [Rhodocyclaceae bacterium]